MRFQGLSRIELRFHLKRNLNFHLFDGQYSWELPWFNRILKPHGLFSNLFHLYPHLYSYFEDWVGSMSHLRIKIEYLGTYFQTLWGLASDGASTWWVRIKYIQNSTCRKQCHIVFQLSKSRELCTIWNRHAKTWTSFDSFFWVYLQSKLWLADFHDVRLYLIFLLILWV